MKFILGVVDRLNFSSQSLTQTWDFNCLHFPLLGGGVPTGEGVREADGQERRGGGGHGGRGDPWHGDWRLKSPILLKKRRLFLLFVFCPSWLWNWMLFQSRLHLNGKFCSPFVFFGCNHLYGGKPYCLHWQNDGRMVPHSRHMVFHNAIYCFSRVCDGL